METILKIENLQKNFGKFQALEDVSFEVNKGEVVGFIGPNGAGKSTTIRILLGIIKKSGGQAFIFDKDVWSQSLDIHKNISYVPGDVSLWDSLSGGEIIDLFMKLHGNGDHQRKEELIKAFDFEPKKKAKSYSKGNRQKVALIAALACDSELYIFDEPTSGLDPLMEAVFKDEVMKLKEKGKAVLLSSHILSEVEKLADRVVIIRSGKIVESGTLDSLRHLTRQIINIETQQDVRVLEQLDGVHDFKLENKSASFFVDNDKLNDVLAKATSLGIIKLESTPPTLEDVFL